MSLAQYHDLIARKKVSFEARGLTKWGELPASLFDHQIHGTEFALRTGCSALFYDTGLGKQQPVTEPVLTPRGWSTMGALKVGDYVIGSDGLPTEVLGVYPQGFHQVYRIELSDGSFVRAGIEHLWSVRTKTQKFRGEPFKALTTGEIKLELHRDWQLPMFAPMFGMNVDLPIDPYAFGVILGDGSCAVTVTVCTDDWIGEKIGWRRTRSHGSCEYVGYWSAPIDVSRAIFEMGLRGAISDTKLIPTEYMHASPAQRLALLQGLMDTDGYAMPEGGAEFCSTSRNLVESVMELVWSLGGVARGLRLASSTYSYKGEMCQGKPAWRVNVKLPAHLEMFQLPRKFEQYVTPSKYPPARIIRDVIDELVAEEQVCIRVAAKDALYVTRNYILTHNTAMALAWGDQIVRATNNPVLMLAPLAVGPQHAREAARLGIDARVIRDGSEVVAPNIYIINYDRLDRIDADQFGGVILDESSILKSFTGATTRKLIDMFRMTPYRLACTATPAPNDHMELGQHSQFLGVMDSNEMLARWFLADQKQMGRYRLKKAAVNPFWDWLASWARCVSKPSDIGFSDDGFILPELVTHYHEVIADISEMAGAEKDGQSRLFRIPEMSATSIHREKKFTLDARADAIAEKIHAEPGEPWVIWCDTNIEADAMIARMPGDCTVEVRGDQSPDEKERKIVAFSEGLARIIISKSSITGFGLNWQHCARQAFVGLNFSYESYYQAVRRCWRFGQKRPVHVHVACADTERTIFDTVTRKADDHGVMKKAMAAAMARVSFSSQVYNPYEPKQEGALPAWLS